MSRVLKSDIRNPYKYRQPRNPRPDVSSGTARQLQIAGYRLKRAQVALIEFIRLFVAIEIHRSKMAVIESLFRNIA